MCRKVITMNPTKKNATQPQEQIKPIKPGTNWTAPKDCVDYDEKRRLNMPESIPTRFPEVIGAVLIRRSLGTNF